MFMNSGQGVELSRPYVGVTSHPVDLVVRSYYIFIIFQI